MTHHSNAKPLQGRGILITRPTHQAAALQQQIEALGGNTYLLPVMEILPPQDLEPALHQFRRIEQFDIAIFISANAARIGIEQIEQLRPLPEALQLAAVGKATARTLEQLGHQADIFPTQRFDSEGLLETPALQQVAGKKILIIRGEGGRELLAETLRQRGAEVHYAEAYRRAIPSIDPMPILQQWKNGTIDAVIVTSNQGLDHLIQMIGPDHFPLLQQSQLVVLSERTREVALERGIAPPPLLAQPPSDQAILDTLLSWANQQQ